MNWDTEQFLLDRRRQEVGNYLFYIGFIVFIEEIVSPLGGLVGFGQLVQLAKRFAAVVEVFGQWRSIPSRYLTN
ncbi:hypothetical protein N2384_00015 [Bacillus paralicheniformis]|uniref:hypothetical protein n=1 Tax=Bacillus paralicheniformis TaxID=1648923 RepID=UPI0021A8529B|nr:hypothetical protein [Bacillus paralicheniformis]UWS61835.1 hypothetical protein N2384_00015 [Bacillus paralicheniformis]